MAIFSDQDQDPPHPHHQPPHPHHHPPHSHHHPHPWILLCHLSTHLWLRLSVSRCLCPSELPCWRPRPTGPRTSTKITGSSTWSWFTLAVRKSIFHQPEFILFDWHSSCTRVLRGREATTTIIISSIILILILLFLLLIIIIIIVVAVITIVTNKTGTGDGWRTASFGGSSCQRTYRRRYQDHIVSWDHHHSRRSCFPHLNLLGKQKSLAFLEAVSGDTWNCLSEMERINSGDPDGSPSIKKSPKQRGILQDLSVNI